MIKIKLSRRGRKKLPFFHVIVLNKNSAGGSNCIEKLGTFNPLEGNKKKRLNLNLERTKFWIQRGAQLSDKMKIMLSKIQQS